MRRRLLLGYLGLTLFVLVSLEIPLGVLNARTERRDVAAKVERDATNLASIAQDAVRLQRPAALEVVASIAYKYAHDTGARVVVVDERGVALIDTAPSGAGAETFATRPEIRAALRGNVASGIRHSATLNASLLYVAVPVAANGVVHGAVRVTYPTSTVDARILHYWLMLAAVAAVVLAVAALVGLRLARFVARPLRGLERAAAAVGEGDLQIRAPEHDGPPEVRSLARVFNETVVKLEQLLRSQEEFVADASHELRTPLTALRLRLENLEHSLSEDGTRDLDAALREVERLAQLVESLLALARADARGTPATRVDAAAVASERVDAWHALADERGVDLVAELDGPAYARAAQERLAQVVDNLVANALDASPAGKRVVVAVRATAPWVELHVRDEGPGLTAEQRMRAFDRFWRAGSGDGGSGLGLAIVKRLVEADEGEVSLGESPGGGLDARVRLRAG